LQHQSIKRVLERWKEHFNDLLNAGAEERQEATRKKPYESNDAKDFPAPSRKEVGNAISKLKNNKAPGDDSLPGELFKAGDVGLVDILHELIVRFWSEEKLPKEWKTGVICPIFKKGCKLECTYYRGISLLSTAYKIFSNILAKRFQPLIERFPGRIQKRNVNYRPNLLRAPNNPKELRDENGNRPPIHRFQGSIWHNRQGAAMKIEGQLSGTFESEVGLRQGDGISTMLFNIALERIVRRSGM
jgi:hypothetical protein